MALSVKKCRRITFGRELGADSLAFHGGSTADLEAFSNAATSW
jgi:hypothetical protein